MRLAAVLTVLEASLALDIVFNGRWLLHDLLADAAMRNNLYIKRAGPQHVVLGLLGISLFAGVGLTIRLFRGRPGAYLAAWGGILSLSCWCVEVISLHAVDSVLYYTVDGVMLVKTAWVACPLMTGIGILWDTFARCAHFRSNNRHAEALQLP